mmetsp:Transcript_8231/g.17162  ORF Transcript_8231/g.17162 Transcript_8231/m.17162 type:complete len:290 (-) Transcript_8231:424-1293(-)
MSAPATDTPPDQDATSDDASVVSLDTSLKSASRGPMSRRASTPMAAPLAPMCGNYEDEEDDSLPEHCRIRFAHPIAAYQPGVDLQELANHRRSIWYQYEELKHLKRQALMVSKEAQKYGLGVVLTHTYGKAETSQDALTTWACQGRRGLERWINDEYAAKRSDIRKRTIQSVLRAQAKMKSSDLEDVDYSTKVLSRLSLAFSIDSQQFARGMGVADAVAAQKAWSASAEDASETSSHASSSVRDPMDSSLRQTVGSTRKSKGGLATARASGRNLGLTAPSVSSDFRHYY